MTHPVNPLESVPDLVRSGTVFLSYRGSESHGTTLPPEDEFGTDDVDLMGAFVHPLEHYFGFGRRQTLERWVGEYDIVEYELGKFVSLLLKSNPNVISLLWLPPRSILVSSPAHERLIENRSLFASKAVYDSFCGYANGQLRRMTRLVDNNPEREREMEALNAELQHRRDMERVHGPGNHARGIYGEWSAKKLRKRLNDLRGVSGYMGEKRRRNVERFGYDVKHGAHAIRLLRMGVEFLRTGEFRVDRTGVDAEELKEIKRGLWTLKRVQSVSERLFTEAEDALRASNLPEKPSREGAEELLVGILKEQFKVSPEDASWR
ncbi:hypothetical protein GBA63_06880 [Rubrobacter tropicus]|uniref:Nucleotidyltransferase n=1 Tax=Rubrobacter tropicus TaxID=2653851 RepID=A0A6G8Q7I2_9ACTN|nr:nucleotidyltransferase domain-containing protein [Rubrobacter tropicus]QIN82402.1 hypothetical protein GBA63_06880 [Rubrobacter tropicus]